MSLYSSREPYGDSTPWVSGVTGSRYSKPAKYGHTRWTFDPRPEYNRPQNNPTNPILVARRNNPGENIYWRDLERWPTESEKEHARKVLTRLAALKKAFQEGNTPDETTFSE